MQPLRNYLQRCPQKWLLKKIKTPYKWRFVAGNIIYKWRMCFFSVAMFDVRRVSSKVGCSSFKTGMGCQSFTSWESSSLHRLYSRSKERIGYRISPSQWAKNLQILEIKMADLSTSAVQHALNSSDMFWIFQVGFHMWWTLQMWWTLKCLKKHPKKHHAIHNKVPVDNCCTWTPDVVPGIVSKAARPVQGRALPASIGMGWEDTWMIYTKEIMVVGHRFYAGCTSSETMKFHLRSHMAILETTDGFPPMSLWYQHLDTWSSSR